MRLDFRVLGPVEVLDEAGVPLDLGSRKQRAVLVLLLMNAPNVVPLDQLIDRLWRDEPPSSATGTLQAYISQLRKILEPGRSPRTPARVLRTREPGYLLDIAPGRLDAHRFLSAADAARTALAEGRPDEAERLLSPALASWRGEPYAEFAEEEFLRPTLAHLAEARLSALATRAEASLARGRAGEVAWEVERLLQQAPYREGLWALLIRALYLDGRQADALAAYQRCRALLESELGLDPSPELRRLEQAVLRQDEGLLGSWDAAVPVAPEPSRAAPALPRLVGREPHLRRVSDRLTDAGRGAGGVLVLCGEPGIGKTRLAECAAELAAERGFAVAWGRCAEDAPAFWPWVQAAKTLDPAIADRLSDGDGGRAAADPDTARFLLHDSVARALERRAAAGPVLIVLEDAHWADAATLKLLTFLGADLHRVPLLVLATVRQERQRQALSDALAELARQRGTERLNVGPLTPADVADYLDGRHEHLRPHVAELHDRTGGNPFFLGELLRLAASEGSAGPAGVSALPVPDGVRDVIAQRVSRLPADSQALLRTAAVAGRDVDSDVLEAAAGIGGPRLMMLLEPAVATGLLVEVDGGWDYRFSHALVQETLYGELSRLQRAQLHGRVGVAIESLARGEAALPVLAHHFGQAARVGHAAKAVSYAAGAARQAAAQLAYDEAVRHWEQALASLDPSDAAARCRLLIELGRARRLTGDVLGARVPLDEAVTLATALGDDDAVIEAAAVFGGVTLWIWRSYGVVDERMVALLERQLARLPETDRVRRAELLGTLAVELYYSDRRQEGLARAAEAVELARGAGDPLLLARTLNNYVIAAWSPQHDRERFAAAAEILTLPGLPRATEIISRLHRMQGLMQDGRLSEYDAELARCVRLTDEVRLPELEAQVTYAASGRALQQGDWAEAARLSAKATDSFERTSLWGPDTIKLISAYFGAAGEGRPSGLLDDLVAAGDDESNLLIRPTAILAALDAGDRALAHRLIDRWGVRIERDWSWQFAAWQWGLIAARLGRPSPESMLAELLPIGDQLATLGTGCVSWGSVHEAVSELFAATGDLARARHHAEAALRAYRRLGLTHRERASAARLNTPPLHTAAP
ncbi:AAA family ATPase [Nonomuraea sp. NN258]|uniref:BTAD domain-containing putative transcriptional regulator n=1 Tax=Nonomuraea antri TaxID=2730852 RepID=UPI001569E831|nr:BTAD domain-containing putative transcriptional regulator [Nonomuraea antri]NRQ40027.1 AAA family ATPase [Nonomuraea antri]